MEETFRILQSIFGIGLIVFVHELGHYLAARWCGVRVETFSLGFGPRLLGLRRGGTMYQVAAVPLGGYCRMAGEERRFDGSSPAPDELPAKSVGQRFLIYVAGVAMNVAFVLVVFPILFHVGVPFLEPRIGDVQPGGPAWEAGIQPETEVLSVNGNAIFEFSQIRNEVALGDTSLARLEIRDPATGQPRTVDVVPRRDPRLGLFTIGVDPAIERDAEGHPVVEVVRDSAAWEAGLRPGDALLHVEGGDAELDPRLQLDRAFAGGGPVRVTVRGESGERTLELQPRWIEATVRRVGISPPRNFVAATRESPVVRELGIQQGDRLLSVNGERIYRHGDLRRALRGATAPYALVVHRDERTVELSGRPLDAEERAELVDALALAVDLESTWIVVQPGESAEEAGLLDGDRVREIDGTTTAKWEDVFNLVRLAGQEDRVAAFGIERAGPGDEPPLYRTIEVRAAAPRLPDYGVHLRRAEYTYRSDSVLEAVGFGFYSSWKLLNELWLTLRALVTADVDSENLGGIITIGRVSYAIAESGWPKFFFFLCFLSMNLAFINLLPIPVLDGGHLFFLVIEKIKGSPVSERVLGYSQMVGVVLILSLMIYVTYNDLKRLFPGG